MVVFIVNIVLLFFWEIFLDYFNIKNKKRIFCVIVFFQFVLLFALRDWEIGGPGSYDDLALYNNYYTELKSLSIFQSFSFNGGKSLLFYFSMSIFSKIGMSFNGYVILLSVFYFYCVIRHIYFHSKNPFLSIFIFLGTGGFVASFYLLRQILSIAFILLAFDAFCKRKNVLFTIFILVASFTHFSAIVTLPLFLVLRIKNDKSAILIGILVVALTLIFRMEIGRAIVWVFQRDYLDIYDSSFNIGSMALMLVMYIVIYCLFYIFVLRNKYIKLNEPFVYFKNRKHTNQRGINLFYGLCFMCVVQICASFSYSFTRLNYFMYVSVFTICVPSMLKVSLKDKRRIVYFKYALYFSTIILMGYLYFSGVVSEGMDSIHTVFRSIGYGK